MEKGRRWALVNKSPSGSSDIISHPSHWHFQDPISSSRHQGYFGKSLLSLRSFLPPNNPSKETLLLLWGSRVMEAFGVDQGRFAYGWW